MIVHGALRPVAAKGGAELIEFVGPRVVEERLPERRVAERAVEFLHRERPQVLRRGPLALRVHPRHLLHHLGEQVEAPAELHPGGELLEAGVAVAAHLLHAAQAGVELLAQVGRRAVGDEQVAVRVERGVPVAGLLGPLGDVTEFGRIGLRGAHGRERRRFARRRRVGGE